MSTERNVIRAMKRMPSTSHSSAEDHSGDPGACRKTGQVLDPLVVGVEIGRCRYLQPAELVAGQRAHDLRSEPGQHRTGQREEQQNPGKHPDAPRSQDLARFFACEYRSPAHLRPPPTSSTKTSSRPISPASMRDNPICRAATMAGIS